MEVDMSILIPDYEERRAFFESAQIAPLANPASRMSAFAAPMEQKIVDSDFLVGKEDGAAIGFTDNVDGERKQAAADSIHFAERYADKYADQNVSPVDWYQKYMLAMKHCGWTSTSFSFDDYVSKELNVSMDTVVLEIIAAVAGHNAPAMTSVLKKGFSKLESDNKHGVQFNNNSANSKGAKFRMVPCVQSPGGTAIAAFMAMDCKITTQEGGALFWKWKVSNAKMRKAACMIELNMNAHNRVKDKMLTSLGKASENFFSGINFDN
jgi:hypothetical protein